VGHTFGASGILSLELAVLMLQHQRFIGVPFMKFNPPQKINRVLINAVGFGGNAVSILLKNTQN
ncbi:MAG: beta-ketoacyl synthase, partial [Eudoraea sp.]